jgi:hypothetical protein
VNKGKLWSPCLRSSGPHYLYRLRPGAKACLNYGKPVAH